MMNKLRITSRADIVRVALAAGILSADTAEHPGAANHEPHVVD
jgi:hypothetical protein